MIRYPVMDSVVRNHLVSDELVRQCLVARLILDEDLKEILELYQGSPKSSSRKHIFLVHTLELKRLT